MADDRDPLGDDMDDAARDDDDGGPVEYGGDTAPDRRHRPRVTVRSPWVLLAGKGAGRAGKAKVTLRVHSWTGAPTNLSVVRRDKIAAWVAGRRTEYARSQAAAEDPPDTIDWGSVTDALVSYRGDMLVPMGLELPRGERPAAAKDGDSATDDARAAPPPADNEQGGGGGKQTVAQALIALCGDVDLFHAPDGTAYAGLVQDATEVAPGHRETHPIRSSSFAEWLEGTYYAATAMESEDGSGKVPGREAMEQALRHLEGFARRRGLERAVYVRVAQPDAAHVYLDLCDAEWRAVEITPNGWAVEAASEVPVRFLRRHGMLALPQPASGGSVADLLRLLHPTLTDRQKRLLVTYIADLLRGRGAHPVLALNGTRGSAKTTTARMVRGVIDPHTADLRLRLRDERDLAIAATNGWVVAFDNISSMPDWLSDGLASLATGMAFATRRLYTGREEELFAATCPVMYTAIPDVASQGDLAERCVRIVLERPDTYVGDDEAMDSFRAALPGILGAFLAVAADGLRRWPATTPDRLPRMAAFARWAAACESALIASSGIADWTPGVILADYAEHQADAASDVLEGSTVAVVLRQFVGGMTDPVWQGTPGELLAALHNVAGDEAVKSDRTWPRSPKALSNALRRLAPDLAQNGITVAFLGRSGHDHRPRLRIDRPAPTKSGEHVPQVPHVPQSVSPNGFDAARSAAHAAEQVPPPGPGHAADAAHGAALAALPRSHVPHGTPTAPTAAVHAAHAAHAALRDGPSPKDEAAYLADERAARADDADGAVTGDA